MRTSEYYGVQVPELGDRADITVVSQAIIDSEDNQSGKVENMKATLSGSIISLVSESRTDKLVKYYNGLAIQFISPVNAQAGTAYKIKIDNLAEQPYNNKTDIKVGDIVQAYYNASGFVSSNTPIPRSSSTSSASEVTVATSLAVKNANDNANTRALKTVQVVAGKGLTGGGDMSTDRTIDVVSKNDGIIVNDNDIQLNVYDGVDSSSTTRAGSAKAVKAAYDKGVEGLNKANTKLDAGSVSTEYNTAKKIEDKIKEKQNKTDDSLESTDKNIVPAINKAFHSNIPIMNLKSDTQTWDFLNEIVEELEMGTYTNVSNATTYTNVPEVFERSNFTYELMPTSYQNFKSINKDEVGKDLMLRLCGRSGFSTNYWDHWTESWEGWTNYLSDKSKLFLGQLGANVISYIQTAGTKTKGNIYIDKTTGKPYRAKVTNTDVTVTTNFEPADNLSNSYDFSEKITIQTQVVDKGAGSSTQRGFFYLQFQKLGKLVFVSGVIRTINGPGVISGLTIPVGFRPAQNIKTLVSASGLGIIPHGYEMTFKTDGSVSQNNGESDFVGVVNLIYKTN